MLGGMRAFWSLLAVGLGALVLAACPASPGAQNGDWVYLPDPDPPSRTPGSGMGAGSQIKPSSYRGGTAPEGACATAIQSPRCPPFPPGPQDSPEPPGPQGPPGPPGPPGVTVFVVNLPGSDFFLWLQAGALGNPSPTVDPGPGSGPSPAPTVDPGPGWVPSPSPSAGTSIIGGPPGSTWERLPILNIATGSYPRSGVALEILAEAQANLCCYPGNLLRFEQSGPFQVAIEMGGWVPQGRQCAACVIPASVTGVGKFTPDRPGKWTFFDRHGTASIAIQVP